MSSSGKSLFSRLDTTTVILYICLVLVGLIAVFSVEYRTTDPSIFMMSKSHMKQTMWLGISLFIGLIIVFTESKFFSSIAYLSYTMGILLLIITIFAGTDVKGSHSWLQIAGMRFQPGEVCKIFTSLALAKFLSSPETNFETLRHRIIGSALVLVPALCIILQKETGLALVYFSFFLVMYREGLPNVILIIGFSLIILTLATLLVNQWVLFGVITFIVAVTGYLIRREIKRDVTIRIILIGAWLFCILFSQVAVPLAFKHVLQKHQVERIYSTLGQEVPDAYMKEGQKKDEKKGNVSDYNVLQSKIAIGSGGFWGKGLLNGTSTKNEFVPEQNTDFIFCAIGEQFGFFGSAIMHTLS